MQRTRKKTFQRRRFDYGPEPNLRTLYVAIQLPECHPFVTVCFINSSARVENFSIKKSIVLDWHHVPLCPHISVLGLAYEAPVPDPPRQGLIYY